MSADIIDRLERELPDGWEMIGDARIGDTRVADALSERLRLELASGHRLFGNQLDAIARRTANDDVVYVSPGGERIVVVHLTWAQTPEPPPFPVTMYDGDLTGFLAWAADA